MNGTRIAPLRFLENLDPPAGTYLFLIEPRRVPPHLAMISDGLYYSLSVKGVETGKDAASLLGALDRKGKGSLLIGVDLLPDAPSFEKAFSAYKGKEPPKSSCLAPTLDILGLAGKGIDTVHGLIAELRAQNRSRQPFLVRDNSLSNDAEELWIPHYKEDDVRAHLRSYMEGSGVYDG